MRQVDFGARSLTSLFSSIRSINELSNVDLQFPIISDPSRKVAALYDMLDEQDITNLDDKGWVVLFRDALSFS